MCVCPTYHFKINKECVYLKEKREWSIIINNIAKKKVTFVSTNVKWVVVLIEVLCWSGHVEREKSCYFNSFRLFLLHLKNFYGFMSHHSFIIHLFESEEQFMRARFSFRSLLRCHRSVWDPLTNWKKRTSYITFVHNGRNVQQTSSHLNQYEGMPQLWPCPLESFQKSKN